jgi:hypothetical protein
MRKEHQCPYCKYTFDSVVRLEAHAPCPEDTTDVAGRSLSERRCNRCGNQPESEGHSPGCDLRMGG